MHMTTVLYSSLGPVETGHHDWKQPHHMLMIERIPAEKKFWEQTFVWWKNPNVIFQSNLKTEYKPNSLFWIVYPLKKERSVQSNIIMYYAPSAQGQSMVHFTRVLLGRGELRKKGSWVARRQTVGKTDSMSLQCQSEAWALWESQDDNDPADTEKLLTSRALRTASSSSQHCSNTFICAALRTGPPQREVLHCFTVF